MRGSSTGVWSEKQRSEHGYDTGPLNFPTVVLALILLSPGQKAKLERSSLFIALAEGAQGLRVPYRHLGEALVSHIPVLGVS